MKNKAVVLFSGGLDSTTCLAVAKSQGYDIHALSFYYGQVHAVEVEHAKHIAHQYRIADHKVITLPVAEWSNSSLTTSKDVVPDYSGSNEIPSTYVPARNTIFLSYALSYAEVIGAYNIFIGANVVDYSGYPDCRPDYISAVETVMNLATKAGREGKKFKIHTPLLQLNKAEIIKLGLSLRVNYQETVSCYRANPKGQACGTCDSCAYRKKGFAEAGVEDPTVYV